MTRELAGSLWKRDRGHQSFGAAIMLSTGGIVKKRYVVAFLSVRCRDDFQAEELLPIAPFRLIFCCHFPQ